MASDLTRDQERDSGKHSHDGRSEHRHELHTHQVAAVHQASKQLQRHGDEEEQACRLEHRHEHGSDEAGLRARQHEGVAWAIGAAGGPRARLGVVAEERRYHVQRHEHGAGADEQPVRPADEPAGGESQHQIDRAAARQTRPRPGRCCRGRCPKTRQASWATTAPRRAAAASRSDRPGSGTRRTAPPPWARRSPGHATAALNPRGSLPAPVAAIQAAAADSATPAAPRAAKPATGGASSRSAPVADGRDVGRVCERCKSLAMSCAGALCPVPKSIPGEGRHNNGRMSRWHGGHLPRLPYVI